VRKVVQDTPELRERPDLERQIAQKMVGVSLAAAELLAEEKRLSDSIRDRAGRRGQVLSEAQTASDIHGRSAVNSAAGVLRATRDAIDFPGFVTSLITGVFQSIQTSSIQQLQAFSDLLGAVNATTSDFATTQITDARAAAWLAEHFSVFAVETDGDGVRVTLRSGAEMPAADQLARTLEATTSEVRSVDEGDLNESLLPLVRRKLARDRQAMLSTMVLMGLQRVVVDDGHIQASMDLRVDARSTAEQTSGEQLDTRVETEASGSFGMGAWGASARMAASVGYVKTDERHTREDIAVQAGLRSNVEVRFHTEPLDTHRMASNRTLDQIRARSMVPETEQARSLLETAPPRATRQPSLPTPAAAGTLIQRDRTLDEARRAREAQSGANVDTSSSGAGSGSTADTGGTGSGSTADAGATSGDTTTTGGGGTSDGAGTTTAPTTTDGATAPAGGLGVAFGAAERPRNQTTGRAGTAFRAER
jgi:hypothetical protein